MTKICHSLEFVWFRDDADEQFCNSCLSPLGISRAGTFEPLKPISLESAAADCAEALSIGYTFLVKTASLGFASLKKEKYPKESPVIVLAFENNTLSRLSNTFASLYSDSDIALLRSGPAPDRIVTVETTPGQLIPIETVHGWQGMPRSPFAELRIRQTTVRAVVGQVLTTEVLPDDFCRRNPDGPIESWRRGFVLTPADDPFLAGRFDPPESDRWVVSTRAS